MHGIVAAAAEANGGRQTANQHPVTWHVDDVDWIPLTGLFIRKAGYKTVVPAEFTDNAYSIELTTIGPGGSSPTHVEPWAHVFYVLSGQGEVTVGEEVMDVRAGSVSPISAGQSHSFRTLGNEPLQMLVIYHPPRARATAAPDKLRARVHQIRHEADSVVSVELKAQDGVMLPPYEPGAHIDLHLPDGLVRSYSLCGSADGHYRIGVLRDRASRGGSAYIHDQLRVGATLDISVPRNNFPLHQDAAHSVFISGGIGITPMLGMLRRLRRLGRTAELVYAARSRKEAAFVEEIEAIGIPVSWHFDDERGGPLDLNDILRSKPADAHFYACGPASMLDAFEACCKTLRYPHAHIERFRPQDKGPSPDATKQYTVTLQRSNRTIEVVEGRSLLDTLLAANVDVPFSCRQGICGTCKTKVLRGEPDHRDSVLSEHERASNEAMMVCVSGCKGRDLLLDI